MITPKFIVTQDRDFVILTLFVKYVKVTHVRGADWYVMGNEFKFHCTPYFLRLYFPFALVEDGREQAVYSIEKGEIVIHLPKAEPGQFFPDLDMLSKLMSPTDEAKPRHPMIEVLSSSGQNSEPVMVSDHPDQFDWSLPPSMMEDGISMVTTFPYGFNNQYQNVFEGKEIYSDALDHPEPGRRSREEIRSLRFQREEDDFYLDHYLADTLLPDASLNLLLSFDSPWKRALRVHTEDDFDLPPLPTLPTETQICPSPPSPTPSPSPSPSLPRLDVPSPVESNSVSPLSQTLSHDILLSPPTGSTTRLIQELDADDDMPPLEDPEPSGESKPQDAPADKLNDGKILLSRDTSQDSIQPLLDMQRLEEKRIEFSQADQEALLRLPKKEFLPNSYNEMVMFGLVDILLAFAYDNRTTLDDSTVESAWTISKLSSTLSWLETFHSMREVLVAFSRRSLTYPLYRNFNLTLMVMHDVVDILTLGKRCVVKALLAIKKLFEYSDFQGLLNRLYIDDYCLWAQNISRSLFTSWKEKLMVEVQSFTREDTGWRLTELEALASAEDQNEEEVNEERVND